MLLVAVYSTHLTESYAICSDERMPAWFEPLPVTQLCALNHCAFHWSSSNYYLFRVWLHIIHVTVTSKLSRKNSGNDSTCGLYPLRARAYENPFTYDTFIATLLQMNVFLNEWEEWMVWFGRRFYGRLGEFWRNRFYDLLNLLNTGAFSKEFIAPIPFHFIHTISKTV